MKLTVDEAIKLMKEKGYNHTATNSSETILFFLKNRDKRIHIHATLFLEKGTVDLDNTGLLRLGVTLYCESISLENVKFEAFEEMLYNYTYLCLYGKHPESSNSMEE